MKFALIVLANQDARLRWRIEQKKMEKEMLYAREEFLSFYALEEPDVFDRSAQIFKSNASGRRFISPPAWETGAIGFNLSTKKQLE